MLVNSTKNTSYVPVNETCNFHLILTRWRERFRHKKGVAHNLELYRNQLDRLKEGEVSKWHYGYGTFCFVNLCTYSVVT